MSRLMHAESVIDIFSGVCVWSETPTLYKIIVVEIIFVTNHKGWEGERNNFNLQNSHRLDPFDDL